MPKYLGSDIKGIGHTNSIAVGKDAELLVLHWVIERRVRSIPKPCGLLIARHCFCSCSECANTTVNKTARHMMKMSSAKTVQRICTFPSRPRILGCLLMQWTNNFEQEPTGWLEESTKSCLQSKQINDANLFGLVQQMITMFLALWPKNLYSQSN